jgi:hypothetical protein
VSSAIEYAPVVPPGVPDRYLKSTTLPGNVPLGAVISSFMRKTFFVL